MMSGEVCQKSARSPAVMARRVGMERGSDGVNRATEYIRQRMLQRGTTHTLHDGNTGTGLICRATARAYC
jgi:hypothetical protein